MLFAFRLSFSVDLINAKEARKAKKVENNALFGLILHYITGNHV